MGTWPGRFGYQGQTWQEIFSANGSQRYLLSPARIYDPSTGRFFQNELILNRRPQSQYLYCSQAPLIAVDPLGLQDDPWGLYRFGNKLLSMVAEPLNAINDVIVGATVAVVNLADLATGGKNQILLDDVAFASNAAKGTQQAILQGGNALGVIDTRGSDFLWNVLTFGGKNAYNACQDYSQGLIDENELRNRWLDVPENLMLAALVGKVSEGINTPQLQPDSIVPQIRAAVEITPDMTVVDLGGIEPGATANVQPGTIGGRLDLAENLASDILSSGESPVVRAYGNQLPFQRGSVDVVITNSVPVDGPSDYMGPPFSSAEILRIMAPDGIWIGDSAPGPLPAMNWNTPPSIPWLPYSPCDVDDQAKK